MKSPFRALLWEQSRVAGVLCLWIIGLGFLLMLCLLLQDSLFPYDMDGFNVFLYSRCCLSTACVWCIVGMPMGI